MEQNKDQSGAAVRGEAVARLMTWCGPSHYAVPNDGVCARTYAEFSKGAGENGGYWKEGEELFTASSLSTRAADALDSQPTDAAMALLREVADMRDIAETFASGAQVSDEFDALRDRIVAFLASSQPTDGGVRNGRAELAKLLAGAEPGDAT